MEIPAPLEMPVEALKRDGGERKPSGEAESSLYNPITPILSSLRSQSGKSRPREAIELLEEESPMKKPRPPDDSSKKAKINMVKFGGEDLYHVCRRRAIPSCRRSW